LANKISNLFPQGNWKKEKDFWVYQINF
jgi:hypothetical protein